MALLSASLSRRYPHDPYLNRPQITLQYLNRQNSQALHLMLFKSHELVQKIFGIIAKLRKNRLHYQPLQKSIQIADYVLLILYTFQSALYSTRDTPQPSLAAVDMKEASHLLSSLHFACILALFLSVFIQIIVDFAPNRLEFRILSKVLGLVVTGSSWLYEATLLPFLLLATHTYAGTSIFTHSWIGVIVGLLTAILFVLIFKDRKVFGRMLPFIFLSRVFLPIEGSILATISVSLLCWNNAKGPFEKTVYLQMALLEVNQYLRRTDPRPITPQVLLNIGIILAVIPLVYLMADSDLIPQQVSGREWNERMMGIIKQVHQKSWSSLTVQQKIVIEAFQTSQQQKNNKALDLIIDLLSDSPEGRLWNAFNAKLSQQIDSNPKDISPLMVKIRLNSLKDANILATFKMLEHLALLTADSGSLRRRFTAFSFIDQIITSLKFKDTLDYEEIKQNDRIQITSQKEIRLFIDSLIDFWEYLRGETLVEQLLMQKLQKLERKKKILQRHLQHFTKIPSLRNSLVVLQFALKCLNQEYQITTPPPVAKAFPFNKQNDDSISYFFSIQKEIIHYMSNSLCRRLGYELATIAGAKKQAVLPSYISNLEQLLTEQHMNGGSTTLPLITAKGHIQPFSGSVLVMPNFEGCFSYFFHLSDVEDEKSPHLIVNTTNEYIDYASKSFKSYFCSSRQQEVRQMDVDELFCCKFDDLVKSTLRDYCLEMKAARDGRKNVKVSKICTYRTGRGDYLFLRVETAKNMERNTMLEIFIHKSIEETAENKYERYKDEPFFCKIAHPLENKYNQQVQRLNDENRWTISVKHGRIFMLMLVIILFNIVFSKSVSKFNDRSASNVLEQLQLVNTARSNLLWLFEDCYQLYYLRHSNLAFIYGANSIPELERDIDHLIHQIEYFRFKHKKHTHNRHFQLTFPSFTIQGSTANTNIIDILQNAKQFLSDNNPAFLIANLEFVRIYNEAYDVLGRLQSQAIQENASIRYCMMGSAGAIFLILLIICADLRDSIEASRHIVKIIMNSKDAIIEGKLKLLRNFKHYLYKNEEVYFFKEESTNGLKNCTSLDKLVDQQKQLQTKNGMEMRTIIKKEDSIMRKLAADDGQDEEAKKMLFTLHSKTAIFTHRVIAYCREAYFFLIFLLALSYFARVALLSTHLSQEKSGLLAYGDSFFVTERNILDMSVGMYHFALSDSPPTLPGFLASTVTINTYFTHPLPPHFDTFVARKNQLVNSNLCQGERKGISEAECSQLEGGFLRKGLGVAFQQYISQVKQISQSLQGKPSSGQVLSALSMIGLIQALMLNKIHQIKSQFLTAANDYLKDQTNNLIYGILWQQALFLGLILLIYRVGMNGYRRRCGTVVQGFLMLPKEYILNNRLLKYFKKHSVFERLANI